MAGDFLNTKEETQGFSISDKTVCIIGCGGLGTNIAVHLAGAGTGKIYLCDCDKVSLSNLNRQFFFTEKDEGKDKCEILKEKLSLYAPGTRFIAVDKKIDSVESLDFAKECDVLICAVDNAQARALLSEFAQKEKLPVIFGSIDGFYGTAYLYLPFKSPCPECAGIISDVPVKASVSSSAGIIGSMQANLAVKYLLTKDRSLSGKIFLFDGDLWETLPVRANKKCKICNTPEVIK